MSKTNKSEKKPVILYLVDAITAHAYDIEDETEEDKEFDRKASNALLAFALLLLPIFRFTIFLLGRG